MGMRCITMLCQRRNYDAALDAERMIGDPGELHSLELPRVGVVRQGHQVNNEFR